eukprot:1140490-Pelagomonas_calceolata.AAC.4
MQGHVKRRACSVQRIRTHQFKGKAQSRGGSQHHDEIWAGHSIRRDDIGLGLHGWAARVQAILECLMSACVLAGGFETKCGFASRMLAGDFETINVALPVCSMSAHMLAGDFETINVAVP